MDTSEKPSYDDLPPPPYSVAATEVVIQPAQLDMPQTPPPLPIGFIYNQQPLANAPTTGASSPQGGHNLNESSFVVTCPKCGHRGPTETKSKVGLLTWAVSGSICCAGLIAFFVSVVGAALCWFGCCLVPFCVRKLKDVEHRCAECQHVIRVYKPLG